MIFILVQLINFSKALSDYGGNDLINNMRIFIQCGIDSQQFIRIKIGIRIWVTYSRGGITRQIISMIVHTHTH